MKHHRRRASGIPGPDDKVTIGGANSVAPLRREVARCRKALPDLKTLLARLFTLTARTRPKMATGFASTRRRTGGCVRRADVSFDSERTQLVDRARLIFLQGRLDTMNSYLIEGPALLWSLAPEFTELKRQSSGLRIVALARCQSWMTCPSDFFRSLPATARRSRRNNQRAICGESAIQALGVPFYWRGD